ncbi:N-acetylmuramoyl-L-alanine amidase [Actinopolymorpha sp. B17G11]|uniref:N-acetylmuramoyl-L-alanine amidase n=1 Tax=Actinopolymorpha sp. B17G11 TaxID=3160861 RepID=UPI0032E38B76
MAEHRYGLGNRGPAVAEIRSKLTQLGLLAATPDQDLDPGAAVFDESVDRAVRQFQQQRGLTANGVVDAETYRVLDEARWRLGDRLMSFQAGHLQIGDDVATLQQRLLELGFGVDRVDGVYGPSTERAVKEFQRSVGAPPDGTCGPATFKALARLSPIVTGGRADALRESERIHRAGPQLPGKVVVIDPGHGGVDRGCFSHGLSEAEIAFDLASRIEGRLAATGVRVFLTRGRDTSPDEAERARFANETRGDLVVSLHVDEHPSPEAGGVATYYYGTVGDDDMRSTLGERFAGLVQREVVARTDLRDCRTHAKTWDLLRYTKMPAVRIELGYVTNAGDALRLSDPGFRDVVAEAIVVAVQRVYLPPDMDSPTGVLQLGQLIR